MNNRDTVCIAYDKRIIWQGAYFVKCDQHYQDTARCCCSVTNLCPTLCDAWTAVQASPSFTVSQSLLKRMSVEWVMSFQPSHTQLLWDTAHIIIIMGLLGGTVLKNLPADAGDARDAGLIPELGRLPGEGNDNPLQYPCLENSMDRGAWQATVQWVTESQTWLSDCIQNYYSRKK